MTSHQPGRVAVVGQLVRDLVLQTDAVPGRGASATVSRRRELLGGKGANHALGLHELGAEVELVAVAGEDAAGGWALQRASDEGIGVGGVVRRGTTALLVDVVETSGGRRLLEHVPDEALLTPADIRAATRVLGAADTVCLQLQQPADALLAAAAIAQEAGARVVLDGAIDGPERDELLAGAQVVRADAKEAAILTGAEIAGRADAEQAASSVLAKGPALVALGVPDGGDLVAWQGGSVFLPFGDATVVDITGAGDAFLAGLVTGVRLGWEPERSARLAAAAASATVGLLGGRPELERLRPTGES